MARIRVETFTVATVGAGQPDYAQPVTEIPVARSLVVKFPETEVAGKRYNDYQQINFTATQQEYVIGVNANNARSGSWPTGTLAKNISFLATQNCYVRFNESDAVQQFILADIIVRFFSRVEKFYVVRDTADGILYAWIEG